MRRILEIIIGLGILVLSCIALISGWSTALPFFWMVGLWAFAVAIGIMLILGKWKSTGVGSAQSLGAIILFTVIGMAFFVAGAWIIFWRFF